MKAAYKFSRDFCLARFLLCFIFDNWILSWSHSVIPRAGHRLCSGWPPCIWHRNRSLEPTTRAPTVLPVSALFLQISQTVAHINCILITYIILPGNKRGLNSHIQIIPIHLHICPCTPGFYFFYCETLNDHEQSFFLNEAEEVGYVIYRPWARLVRKSTYCSSQAG